MRRKGKKKKRKKRKNKKTKMRSADRIKCRSSQVTGLCSVLLSLSVHSLNKVFVNNFSFSLSLSLSLSLSFSFSRAYLSLCCSHQRTPPLKGLQATCSLFFFFFFFSLSLSLSLSLSPLQRRDGGTMASPAAKDFKSSLSKRKREN